MNTYPTFRTKLTAGLDEGASVGLVCIELVEKSKNNDESMTTCKLI